jgi:phosphohistidine phosphatase
VDVVLIRHAAAIDETLELRDPMRMLTAEGRTQARELGQRLRRQATPTHVWTSPLVRAVQTAELVVAALGADLPVDVLPSLAPGESTRHAIAAIRALPATARVLVVGHEPSLSAIGAVLLGREEIPAIGKAEALTVSL